MRALLLGSGGREHALAWALSRSSLVEEVVAAPGNPGIAELCETEAVQIDDARAVVAFARRVDAGLVVVGPEAPLVAGVGDALRKEDLAVFGPGAEPAQIEGSKSFAKSLMERAQVPTAAWRPFQDANAAVAYLDEVGPPYVIKADGLAAGKGVVVTGDRAAAATAVKERLVEGRFGEAGRTIVVEEFLDGEEASVIAISDGERVAVCEPAQDYKRALDNDAGPNTGGMGSYSPVPACPTALSEQITAEIIQPMVDQLRSEGTPFVGALYAGLALTSKGPKVIEFNARFGDPETQALLPRLRSDFGAVCYAAATGDLSTLGPLEWTDQRSVCVVLASGGYPGSHETGYEVEGLEKASRLEGVHVFHAGTTARDHGVVTAGGRVLAVTALASSFGEARRRAYQAVDTIDFEGKHVRRDIGARAELREGETG